MVMANKTIINWEAQEYVEYKKNAGWYIGLAVVTLALCGLAIWLNQISFLILIVVAAAALLTYTLRKPRMLHYSLSDKGLSEGNNLHAFGQFKSFGILNENNRYSIVLIPKQRFLPRMIVAFPETEGEQIVDVFGNHLPMEPVKLDAIDKLIRLLRI